MMEPEVLDQVQDKATRFGHTAAQVFHPGGRTDWVFMSLGEEYPAGHTSEAATAWLDGYEVAMREARYWREKARFLEG